MTTLAKEIFKTIAIPPQLLQHSELRYIIIRKDGTGKLPAEKKWQIERNYPANEPKLRGWMRGGGNYGVATGFGSLVVLDADEVEKLTKLNVIQKLPSTFTVKTGGGGLHYYFFCKGLGKIVKLFDPETNEHLGEIQANGAFVIGPTSVHRTGNKYEIINDAPITTIEYDDLMDIIRRLRVKKITEKSESNYTKRFDDVDIERIATPMHAQTRQGSNGREIYGENPFHGATKAKDRGTSNNFHMNISKGVWHCHACGSGGGWMELLAVAEGMIRCDQAAKNCLTRSQRRDLLEIAESKGLIKTAIPQEDPNLDIIEDRIVVDKLPLVLPNNKIIVIKKPPRIGGTHWSVVMMNRYPEANYVTHRHSIVEHAVKVAEEIRMKGVVWLVGMSQPGACRRDVIDCENCPLKPNQTEYMKQQKVATMLMRSVGVLTITKVPETMCPYYTMRMAEPFARYCFTVSNNIDSIRPRELVILDEDPTLQVFYPPSIHVATTRRSKEEDRTINGLATITQELDKILVEGKKKKLKPYAEVLSKIRDTINDNKEYMKSAEKIAFDIKVILESFVPTNVNVREEGEMDGEVSLEACVRCLGHLYEECPVSVQSDGQGGDKIYLIGDEREPVFAMDWMDKVKHVVIIGATKAEMFAKKFDGMVVEVDKFGYKDRYTVLLLKDTEGKNADMMGKRNILKIAKTMWGNAEQKERMPFMVLTGSKGSQKKIVGSIPGSCGVKSEKENGLAWGFISGVPIVFYQNSVISRGLDVDQFNLMLVHNCNFAQPFWSIVDKTVMNKILIDETTNAVLRMSPTLRRDEGHMKVVVMRESDWWKVRYLDGKERVVDANPEMIGNSLKRLWVGGKVEITSKATMVMKSGIANADGITRLGELMASPEDWIGDADLKLAQTKVLQYMKTSKRGRKLVHTTEDIVKNIQLTWMVKRSVVKLAIQHLYNDGILRLVKSNNKGQNWWGI